MRADVGIPLIFLFGAGLVFALRALFEGRDPPPLSLAVMGLSLILTAPLTLGTPGSPWTMLAVTAVGAVVMVSAAWMRRS